MKKSKPGLAGIHDPAHLFRETALTRHRRLILPRYLEEEANKPIHEGKDRDEAHKILIRWADLESKGHLEKKETSLNAQFLHEIFGDALRYAIHSRSPEKYFLEREFTVPGIGTADGALGLYPPSNPANTRVVIELKDAGTDLDFDKFNGRTPVQQTWDYLYNLPDCSLRPFGSLGSISRMLLCFCRNRCTPLH